MRIPILSGLIVLWLGSLVTLGFWPPLAAGLFIALTSLLLSTAIVDVIQPSDSIKRNYPLVGRLVHLMEEQKHILQENLLMNRREGRPFDEVHKNIAQSRAKDELLNQPFGTDYDLYRDEIEYVHHSLFPTSSDQIERDHRYTIGENTCEKPYSSSLINVSGMSLGSISPEAVTALARGASQGRFALNTGEGGHSKYHEAGEPDVIFQFGTGYFGCRTENGRFCDESFAEIMKKDSVRMAEIKVNQGAKPGYGALLPAKKNTKEIAEIRDLKPGHEVHSPPHHKEFDDPESLCRFISRLRESSQGKPIGVKFCLGRETELKKLAEAFQKHGGPDYIAVDGAEGGTGAAHFEALHFTGMPLAKALRVTDETLKLHDLRQRIKVLASGKLITAFDILRAIEAGADGIYMARGFMFALGCVQSLKCNKDTCPVGLTTMDPKRRQALVPSDKAVRVANFHRNTLRGVNQMLSACGLEHVKDFSSECYRSKFGA